jgi:hypothetical protein
VFEADTWYGPDASAVSRTLSFAMHWRFFAAGCAVAAAAAAVIIATVESWSPEAWAALAAWVTVGVAAAAGYIALGQLNEAARLRREQAQPYVVAFIEPSAAGSMLIELVLKNFGATAAHDVRLKITPTPERAIDADTPPEQRHVWLPERIPVLVPGQEWRTLWDTGMRRYDEQGEPRLPEHHDATISYTDSHGEPYKTAAVLDWRMLADREIVEVYGSHHAAKALRDISKTMGAWKESGGQGLRVFTRDGDARDPAARERHEQRLAERARQNSDPSAEQ